MLANPSLGDYLAQLKSKAPQEILEISTRVPRDYVITALALELERRKQYPVIIANAEGYSQPIVANIFSSRKRIADILGCPETEITHKWSQIEKNTIEPTLVATGPVHEMIYRDSDIDVTRLPIMQHFDTDAGRYITSGIVVAKDPETGIRNLSYHRMQLKGPRKFGISLHSRQHLFSYLERAERLGRHLEIAVMVGAHPALLLAASAKPGIEVDECDIAGAILQEPVELLHGLTVDVEYPAAAEIVLEGRILAGVREPEGPFGEFSGYSTSRSTQNVFEVTAMCCRRNPVYLSIVPGPAADHLYLARVAREAAILKRLKEKIPYVKDICYPKSGVNFHCYLSIERAPEGVARHALTLLFGLDHYVKLAVVVDEDIDVNDEEAVWWAVATRVQGDKDIIIIPRLFTIPLDPSSERGMSAKVGIDATMTEDFRKEVVVCKERPQDLSMARDILKQSELFTIGR